jgi:hypothetical protein
VARLTARLGPFPFDTYGGTAYPSTYLPDGRAQALSRAALEVQGGSIYGEGAVSATTVVHETAHQWFGDSVSVMDWGEDLWWVVDFAHFAETAFIDEAALDRPGRAPSMRRAAGADVAWPSQCGVMSRYATVRTVSDAMGTLMY